jgi:hypothetical protein
MLIRMRLLIPFALALLFKCNINCTSKADKQPASPQTDKRRLSATDQEQRRGNILKGTTILTASEKNMSSRVLYGLGLDSVAFTECEAPSSETPTPTRITEIRQPNDSTLIISTSISANCAYDFLVEIEVVSNNTLNLIYHGYGGYASCECCFGVTYIISLTKEDDYDLNNLKFVTLNGYSKTRIPTPVGKNLVSH